MKYPGMGVDLGVACGKPFSISALAVLEPGDSEILSFGSMNE
jgi:large subunit ribosomal protein L30e